MKTENQQSFSGRGPVMTLRDHLVAAILPSEYPRANEEVLAEYKRAKATMRAGNTQVAPGIDFITALLCKERIIQDSYVLAARNSYKIADAMLAARVYEPEAKEGAPAND